MLPVGDRPLLERTLERLRDAGITSVSITTHYLAEAIAGHFGDGHAFGLDVDYVTEDRPLGTAGALARMGRFSGTLLVMNGDILTGVDFRDMLAFHRMHGADATVGVRRYDVPVPYGVVECDGRRGARGAGEAEPAPADQRRDVSARAVRCATTFRRDSSSTCRSCCSGCFGITGGW